MAVEKSEGSEPRVEPSTGPLGGSVPANKGDGVKGKAPSQGSNPDDLHDSEGVTPESLKGGEVYAPDAAGTDPDSLERTAKQLAGMPGDDSNDHADELREKAAESRKKILEREDEPRDRRAAGSEKSQA